jgi:hypothetical protein
MGAIEKIKIHKRKERKGFKQSSQCPDSYRDKYQYFSFACFAKALRSLQLKKTFLNSHPQEGVDLLIHILATERDLNGQLLWCCTLLSEQKSRKLKCLTIKTATS